MEQICASDLHLGFEQTNYDKICKMFNIAESKADELILCGDTFDLWRYPVSKIDETTMVGFENALISLKETANEIPVKIIQGNHDYNLQKVWDNKLRVYYNVEISDSFYQGNIYFTHGWEFDITQRMCSFTYKWLVEKFPYIYQRFFKKPSQMGIPREDATCFLSEKVHIEAEEFALKNKLKYVIMGHTHIPMMFRHVVDCGDFVDSCSYVTISNKKPKIKFI